MEICHSEDSAPLDGCGDDDWIDVTTGELGDNTSFPDGRRDLIMYVRAY
jgi:hypothetical protein